VSKKISKKGTTEYEGVLAIGDPHLEDRVPGYRSDDYPRVILQKLQWCLDTARRENLMPVLLGDLFQVPRNNPNWLIVEVLDMFESQEVFGIVGNHDIYENELNEHDSLRIVEEAGRLHLLDASGLDLEMAGVPVRLGGTNWGQPLPGSVETDGRLVLWFTHHDLHLPGFERSAKVRLGEIPGVDVVVNGHIHKRMPPVQRGSTRWINPGNIARRERSQITRDHVPAALELRPTGGKTPGWTHLYREIPHRGFAEVFHAKEETVELPAGGPSGFVAGLAELHAERTSTGTGLMSFLDKHLDKFDGDVATEIRRLAKEVTDA